ncbi:hypothetical protein QOT17_024947 [Balamuthia mandrillaris]
MASTSKPTKKARTSPRAKKQSSSKGLWAPPPSAASSSPLQVPVAIWDGPPTHRVTCVVVSPDGQHLITGSRSGQLCVWTLSRKKGIKVNERLQPLMMLIGCTSPILALAFGTHEWTSVVVSLSEDGTLCAWDYTEGCCVDSVPQLFDRTSTEGMDSPTKMVTMPDNRHIACAGQSSLVFIVDLWTMKVVHKIKRHSDWVIDLFSCDLGGGMRHHPCLLSMGIDGILHFSSLLKVCGGGNSGAADGSTAGLALTSSSGSVSTLSPEFALQTLCLSPDSALPVAVSVSPSLQTLLILTETHWLIYTMQSPRLLASVECPTIPTVIKGASGEADGSSSKTQSEHNNRYGDISRWSGAAYLSPLQIVIWAENGTSFIYDLPEKWKDLPAFNLSETDLQGVGHIDVTHTNGISSAGITEAIQTNGASNTAGDGTASSAPTDRAQPQGSMLLPGIHRRAEKIFKSSSSPHLSSLSSSHSPIISSSTTLINSKTREKTAEWKITVSPSSSDEFISSSPDQSITQTAKASISGPKLPVLSHVYDCGDTFQHQFADKAFSSSSSASMSSILQDGPSSATALPFSSILLHCHHHMLVAADKQGHVLVWRVPRPSYDYSSSATIPTTVKPTVTPWAYSSLSWGWPSASLSSSSTFSTSPASQITFSLIEEESLTLLRGYENGDISIRDLPTRKQATSRRIKHAHSSRITSLLTYHTGTRDFLVSSSADCLIKVWNLRTLELLHVFSQHTNAVTQLYQPYGPFKEKPAPFLSYKTTSVKPDQTADRDDTGAQETHSMVVATKAGVGTITAGVFLSVSMDKSVGLFSLENMNCMRIFGGHATQIAGIGLKILQDYLIVHCEDGSVSVWELSSGILESCVHGRSAMEILHSTTMLTTENTSIDTSQRTAKALSLCVGERSQQEHHSPLQILLLDIKNIVHDLYTHLRQPSATSSTPSVPTTSSTKKAGHRKSTSSIERGSSGEDSSSPCSWKKTNPCLRTQSVSLFTYLIPWNASTSLDRICREELRLMPPDPAITVGIQTTTPAGNMYSMLVPGKATGAGRWQISSHLTALHTLSAVTVIKTMLQLGDNKNATSQLLSYFCALAPDMTPNYIGPSLPFLARYWQDPFDDVMQSARSIFSTTTSRMSPESLKSFALSWSSQLRLSDSGISAVQSKRASVVLVLAILASERPDCIDEMLAREATKTLLRLLKQKSNNSMRVTAAELLGKGFAIWKPYVKSLRSLVRALFALTLVTEPPNIAGIAHHSLMLIGIQEPRATIDAIGEIIARTDIGTRERSDALALLGSFVKKDPVALLPELPRLVDTVVRSLDPNVPHLRESCLKGATTVLHSLVKLFPMVSFHQKTQRLAVGSERAVIVIYDLKTATKWHVLEGGHKSAITALLFNRKGDTLASYAMEDSNVVIWGTKSSFLYVFGSNPHCIQISPVPKISPLPLLSSMLDVVEMDWVDDKTLKVNTGPYGKFIVKLTQ